jgi:hypothetical protein
MQVHDVDVLQLAEQHDLSDGCWRDAISFLENENTLQDPWSHTALQSKVEEQTLVLCFLLPHPPRLTCYKHPKKAMCACRQTARQVAAQMPDASKAGFDSCLERHLSRLEGFDGQQPREGVQGLGEEHHAIGAFAYPVYHMIELRQRSRGHKSSFLNRLGSGFLRMFAALIQCDVQRRRAQALKEVAAFDSGDPCATYQGAERSK